MKARWDVRIEVQQDGEEHRIRVDREALVDERWDIVGPAASHQIVAGFKDRVQEIKRT
jgi:hypothetical protein